MKKLQEINRLVEEAYKKLADSDTHEENFIILTSLARKCAEINSEDFPHFSNTPITDYNSRLRDGQVEEVKQEEKPALQPLPENAPEWFQASRRTLNSVDFWNKIRQHFGTPPREWWRDLKKGDKFRYYDLIGDEVLKTFSGKYSCIDGGYFLYTIEVGDNIGIDATHCSPYTDPTQSFRSKLTPEMQVEFDKVIETINNTPQP